MLVNKQDVVLEAGVEMRFESQVDDNGIVMAVDVRIHAVQTLKDLAKQTRERLRERDTCFGRNNQSKCHQIEQCFSPATYQSCWETSARYQCCFEPSS